MKVSDAVFFSATGAWSGVVAIGVWRVWRELAWIRRALERHLRHRESRS